MNKMTEELLKPRTIFAFMFYGAFIWLILHKVAIPDPLNTIVSVLMGYYFGSRGKNNTKEVNDVANN